MGKLIDVNLKGVVKNRKTDARGNTGAVASGDHSTAIVDNSTTHNVTLNPSPQAVVTDADKTLTEEQKRALSLLREEGWVDAQRLTSDGVSRRVLETLENLGYVEAKVTRFLSGSGLVHYRLTDRGVRVVEMLLEESN